MFEFSGTLKGVCNSMIISIGSKSLSHVLSIIDRCRDRLLRIGERSDAARRQIITSVFDFWADHRPKLHYEYQQGLAVVILRELDLDGPRHSSGLCVLPPSYL